MGKRKPRPKIHKKALYDTTVQILSHPVHIFRTQDIDDEGNQGEFHIDKHEIYVQPDPPSSTSDADRMLHEILHAMSTIGLEEEDRLNETQVNTLSLMLTDFIAKNTEFIERLVRQVRE